MVGQGSWLADVTHNVKGDKTYANLNNANGWSFRAPVISDPVAGTNTEVTIPEVHGNIKVFLYENDGISDELYKAMFDELYVEGEYEARDGKPARSKNIIQERIMGSVKFSTSRLARILNGQVTTEALEELPTGGDVDPLAAVGLA